MTLQISSKKSISVLFVLVFVMNAIGVFGRFIENLLGYERTTPVVRLFHVAQEGNITTWFSSILLLISAVLLALIAKARKSNEDTYVLHWALLAIVFLYMSIDEAARIHELTIEPLRNALNVSGIFYYAWVIIAIPAILFVGIFYLRFLLNLPRSTRLLFLLAGAIFIFGGLGLELIGGYVVSQDLDGYSSVAPIVYTIEEFMENLGVAIFIAALILYMKQFSSNGRFLLVLD